MKRIFAILMTICLLAGALSITAFAADEPATDYVMTVSGLTKDGPVKIKDYTSFEAGWNFAMEKAKDSKYLDNNQYDRIVVDLFADWKANEKGVFGDDDGVGFPEYTIYIPEEARVMLNMNGHTIDRGLGDRNQFDGEVIYIDEKADVIINGGKSGDVIARADDANATFGTITGGNNDGGAGGIHIQDDAKVTLNNVKILANVADGDDGAGIAVYDDAKLTVNGGGFINNKNNTFNFFSEEALGAGIYIEDSTAIFENVLFQNNQFTYFAGSGAAVYADSSSVTMNNCKVIDNGKYSDDNGPVGAFSTITLEDGTLVIKNTDFIGNGSNKSYSDGTVGCLIDVDFYFEGTNFSIDSCTFTQNEVEYILRIDNEDITVTKSRFTDNPSSVLHCSSLSESVFTDCVFNNNIGSNHTFTVDFGGGGPTFINCDMGNSTYNDRNSVQIKNGGTSSIFGEGSFPMIIAILSFIASGVSIFLVVYYNKKKTAPVAVNQEAQAEDEE